MEVEQIARKMIAICTVELLCKVSSVYIPPLSIIYVLEQNFQCKLH